MADDLLEAIVPEHVDKAVRSVTQLHSEHRGRTIELAADHKLDRRPHGTAVVYRSHRLGFGPMDWGQLAASGFGLQPIDPPPFAWLEIAATLFSLFLVVLLLVAQKHEDELNAHRDTLTLELAILSEHKIAKVIQLLEELRRDSPHVQDRDDPQAEQMAEPADAESVLAAVRDNDQQQ